jgi:cell division protein FtsN
VAPDVASAPEPRQAAAAPRLTARVASAIAVSSPSSKYWVQIGAFQTSEAATRLVGRMKAWALTIVTGPLTRAIGAPRDSLSRVLVGPFAQRTDAVAALKRLQAAGVAGFVAEDRR